MIESAQDIWSSATALLSASPSLSAVGFLIGGVVTLALLLYVLSALISALHGMRRTASLSRIRARNEVGARIVIAQPGGGRRRAITRFMGLSSEKFLQDYMFGGKFVVIRHPGGVANEAQAAAFLKKSEADIVVWSESRRGVKGGLACILSRPTRPNEKQRPASRLAMPKRKTEWTEMLARASAYAVAKQYRPALGRPQDFRAERLTPVVESLLSIRHAAPNADPALMADITDDASAGALQIASSEPDWVPPAEQIARETLASLDRTKSPDRWINAKIALGRALRLRAEQKFDPVILREAVTHLQDAMDALRNEPRLRLAETAAQSIADSQRLLTGQRKFSITGGGI